MSTRYEYRNPSPAVVGHCDADNWSVFRARNGASIVASHDGLLTAGNVCTEICGESALYAHQLFTNSACTSCICMQLVNQCLLFAVWVNLMNVMFSQMKQLEHFLNSVKGVN